MDRKLWVSLALAFAKLSNVAKFIHLRKSKTRKERPFCSSKKGKLDPEKGSNLSRFEQDGQSPREKEGCSLPLGFALLSTLTSVCPFVHKSIYAMLSALHIPLPLSWLCKCCT